MEHQELHEPFFLPLTSLRGATRGRKFIRVLDEVLKFSWLKTKTPEDIRKRVFNSLLPCFARRCIENNDFASLQEILMWMDVNLAAYDGYTVMHTACEKGRPDMVTYLLSHGATIQLENDFGCTPLHIAIKNKHFGLIRILRLKEATVNLKPVRIGMNLVKAVETKDYQLLRAWYMAGVNIDQSDYNGQTALHTAVQKRDTNMVAKLLEYGATQRRKDVWGRTAVDEAKKNNLHDILVLFQSRYPI